MLDLRAPRLAVLGSALLVALALAACGASNPNFCEGAGCDDLDATPDSAPQACTGTGADPACPPENPICVDRVCGGPCTADTDCAGRTDGHGVCLVPTGDCVACDESDAQAAPGSAEDECPTPAMAVCDAQTHICRACEDHGECASGVCDAGTCVPAANVVYMKPDGTDDSACGATPATGCLTMQTAINKVDATRRFIVMAPTPSSSYTARTGGGHADFNNKVVHVIGYGATVRRSDEGQVIEVRGGGSNVVIEGLTIDGGRGTNGSGVLNSSSLELRRVKVSNNEALGVVSTGGALRIVRSTITANRDGGLQITSGTFVVVNNFIHTNGDPMSAVGGGSITAAMAGNVFEFNTVIGNVTIEGFPDGLSCNGMLAARNNIIFGESTRPRINVGSTCTFTYTLYGPNRPNESIAGAGNMLVPDRASFMFVAPGDFHVQAGSIATGNAQATNLTGDSAIDFDGDPRQQGGTAVEVGADEIP